MQFVNFLHSVLNITKRMFLTYKADYINIFLKPLATTHLLGIKATTVTLYFYTEFNLKKKSQETWYIMQQIMK